MVGPFMQGFLLLGIIYWYSKGMMSMINDYYRSEFQRKLKVDNVKNQTVYDLEDLAQLINVEASSDADFTHFDENFAEVTYGENGIRQAFCKNPSSIVEFLYESWLRGNQKVCWISKEREKLHKYDK